MQIIQINKYETEEKKTTTTEQDELNQRDEKERTKGKKQVF